MKNHKVLLSVIIILFLAGVLFSIWFFLNQSEPPLDQNYSPDESSQDKADEVDDQQADYTSDKGVVIKLNTPKHDQIISSPLEVRGEVPGNWSFEADFPIIITDFEGNELGRGIAMLQGDWMTEDYVPFAAEITFDKPVSSDTGFLILEKDNASGLPEHDDQLKLAIKFKQAT